MFKKKQPLKPILIEVFIDGRIVMQSKKPKLSTQEAAMKHILEKYAKIFPPVPAGRYWFSIEGKGLKKGTDLNLTPYED